MTDTPNEALILEHQNANDIAKLYSEMERMKQHMNKLITDVAEIKYRGQVD